MTTIATPLPDLLGITLVHRTMRRDLHRLTEAAQRIAAGGSPCPDRRAAAITVWTGDLCAEIHHHHRAEDEIAWPVIVRHAGTAIDLSTLTDDHAGLDPLLDDVRAAVLALRAAADGDPRRAAAAELAGRLARLRDELDEHLDVEESQLFPVIERYVPAPAWTEVEKGVRAVGGPGPQFTLPRMADVASREEWAAMQAKAGMMLSVMTRVLRPAHRRRERLVFG